MVFAWFIGPAEKDMRPNQFSGDRTPQDLWFLETLEATGLDRAAFLSTQSKRRRTWRSGNPRTGVGTTAPNIFSSVTSHDSR